MQGIYDREVLFFAPSLGRGDSCTTHLAIPSVKYVVAESEAEEYAKRVPVTNIEVVSDEIQCKPSGKCRTRTSTTGNGVRKKAVQFGLR